MTPAKHILNLIKNVAADDTDMLDEIDILVSEHAGNPDTETERRQGYTWKSYTISLDAAISILPPELVWSFENHAAGYDMYGYMDLTGPKWGRWHNDRMIAKTLPLGITAIGVQAIEFNREKEIEG